MKGFEEADVEKMKDLISEVRQMISQRRMLEAKQKLNSLNGILLFAKDVNVNPDLELDKDITLSGE
jgi:hypothetical protein